MAVSDPTGTLARPLTVVAKVDGDVGFAALLKLLSEEAPERIVVGLPVSLDGTEREQAALARAFATRLADALDIPVALYDERFTSKVADQRGGRAARDARAAANLLEDSLRCAGDQFA